MNSTHANDSVSEMSALPGTMVGRNSENVKV